MKVLKLIYFGYLTIAFNVFLSLPQSNHTKAGAGWFCDANSGAICVGPAFRTCANVPHVKLPWPYPAVQLGTDCPLGGIGCLGAVCDEPVAGTNQDDVCRPDPNKFFCGKCKYGPLQPCVAQKLGGMCDDTCTLYVVPVPTPPSGALVLVMWTVHLCQCDLTFAVQNAAAKKVRQNCQ